MVDNRPIEDSLGCTFMLMAEDDATFDATNSPHGRREPDTRIQFGKLLLIPAGYGNPIEGAEVRSPTAD